EPANGAPAVQLPSNIHEMGLGGPLSLGAHRRLRSDSTRGRPSMMQGKTVVLILGAVPFSAMGQLFLKSGAQHLAGLGRLEVLPGLRRWRGHEGAGVACLLCPVPGSGLAAPVREVLEGSDRLPARRASGAKVPPILRASPGLDGWSAGQDPGYRRAGPPPTGL